MGVLTRQTFQLNSTTLCRHHSWQERELKKKKCRLNTIVPFSKLSLSASSCELAPHLPSKLWCHKHVFAETSAELNAAASIDLRDPKDGSDSATVDGHDECTASNPSDAAVTWPDDVRNRNEPDGHDACMTSKPPDAATAEVDGVLNATGVDGGQNERSGPYASNSSNLSFDGVQHTGEHECTATNPSCAAANLNGDVPHARAVSSLTSTSKPADFPSIDACNDTKVHDAFSMGAQLDATASIRPSKPGETEGKGKIRRFSLNKTLQEVRALTPLEQENLDQLMRFKLTSDDVKGQLVIRAVRTEQLRDLETLLTDSYSELMWGPLTYRPVLEWILSTYLRERQAYLPHAVTLVGLYAPSEETNDPEVSTCKWWVAGAVEISFNASGKPKDMQTPLPPEDAPFLSNMAVLKKFRRRGIGRELLRAAEQLAVQMGGTEMYLHCRMIDEAPLNMYKKSGYAVAETDSILSLLLFQRRRHLMYKTLAAPLHEETMVQVE
eukprot:c43252_g1_i1 orf=675-2162(-)